MSGSEIAGERSRATDATGTNGKPKDDVTRRALIAATVLSVSFGLGIAFYLTRPDPKKLDEPKKVIRQTSSFEPAPEPKTQIVARTVVTPPVAVAALPANLPVPAVDPLLESARRAPVVAYKRTPSDSAGSPVSLLGAGELEADDKGLFERRLKPPRLEGAKAGLIGNRDMIVPQGTSIPCVLETALQSDQPGFTSCVITRDVLSDNGRVVLMEKGTQIVGEYRGGLNQGQTRLHVLWSRAKTPTGVIVELASPGTDALGRSGFDGVVDNHWWERFGSALLLSVVSDATAIGVQQVQKSNGVSAANTGNSGKEAAAIAVEQTAAIKPTLHKNQGELVSIFVARDLDFSSVYKLTVVDHRRVTTTPIDLPGGSNPSSGSLK